MVINLGNVKFREESDSQNNIRRYKNIKAITRFGLEGMRIAILFRKQTENKKRGD